MNLTRANKVVMALSLFLAIGFLLGIVYLIQISGNRKQANMTSTVLMNQIEHIIANNKAKEETLVASLKEDYIAKARAVSYIVDHNPETENNLTELMKIARLNGVDEIHLFDETGTIYGGTTPQYYGFSFDSGEQMAYFKPMLTNKERAMCQDVTLNTAEEKPMMYAICWNEQGTRMTQIGISPGKLLQELESNSIAEVVNGIAAYAGISVLVADRASGEILGATDSEQIGRNLLDIGMDIGMGIQNDGMEALYTFISDIDGEKSHCAVRGYEEYLVAIIQQSSVVNRDVPRVVGIVAVYLFLALAAAFLIILKMSTHVRNERKNASTDYITGLLNRRGYENSMQLYGETPLEENFVYVSIDLNGLKQINDSLGHSAGDEVIRGAAQCMKTSFGAYGKVFRIGGDEFVAMIIANDIQLEQIEQDFAERTRNWRGNLVEGLAVSLGYVKGKEFPEKTLSEIAKIADARMYEAKREYYRTSGMDRRGRNA